MNPTEKLHIALVEFNPSWLAFEDNLKALNQLEIRPETHLVVLPEMFATGFCMKPDLFVKKSETAIVEWMKTFSTQHQKAVCGSVAIEEDGHYYNRFYFCYLGKCIAKYDKRHLFTYSGENEVFTPGNEKIVFSFLGWNICPQICYDLRFPVWFRNTQPYYDILLNVSNWPDSRTAIWKQLIKARAVENMCYMVGCNRIGKDGNQLFYSGDSNVRFPSLEKLEPIKKDGIKYFTLDKNKLEHYRNKYPFLEDQDTFKIE